MGLFAEAVTLALESNNIDIAQNYANLPESDDQKKKLWMQIAIHMFEKEVDISEIMKLTSVSKLLRIKDLLPYFSENTTIEYFKKEICESLSDFSVHIDELKAELEGFSKNSEGFKSELRSLKNNYIVVSGKQTCEECFHALFNEEFCIFPCKHGFHRVKFE